MPPWHSAQCPPHTPNPDPQRLAVLYDRAQTLHGAETKKFHAASGNSEASFLAKMASGGTLSDRLSALTLLIQSSPIHNTAALETLRSIAQRGKGKGGREDALKALRCIVDWWVGGGAPRSRKLRYFRDAVCLDTAKTEDSHLVLWYFEDWLKKYFFSILQVLETLSLDTLPYIRTQSLTLITNLLKDTPEQEQNLLRLLVNKLGDVEKSICSRASHHILQLLQTHPAMKSVVVKEMVALVMKPSASSSSTAATVSGNGQNSKITFSNTPTSTSPSKSKSKPPQTQLSTSQIHARYYAVVTFNQIVLSSSPTDRQVALKLLDVYFDLFRQVLGLRESQPSSSSQKRDDAPSDDDDEKDPEAQQQPKLDSQGRVIDYATHPKKKAKRRSQLDRTTKKGAAGFAEIQDSDSKLVGAILTGVNRAVPFVGLDLGLQGGDGADGGKEGIRKHIDTLFLISHKSTFNISIQALVLLQQISAALMEASSSSGGGVAKSIVDRYYRTLYASLLDPRLGTSNKQAMYLNLFFKSVKASVAEGSGLSREQKVERKERKKDRRRKEKSKAKGSDDEEEDQPRIAEDETRRQSLDRTLALVRRFIQVLVSAGPAAGVSGGVEFVSGGLFLLGELFSSIPGLRTLILHPPLQQETSSTSQLQPYDPHKRDPLYTHASSPLSPLWLLNTLTMHYHPAISLHASQILQGKQVTASADLELGSLGHFLERFVYKNAKVGKKAAEKGQGEDGWDEDAEEGRGREEKKLGKGGSAMQPSAAALEGVKKGGVGGNGEGGGGVDPSDRAFWGRSEASLPVDQIFFARYFKRKEEGEKKRGKKGKKDEEGESEGEGEGSEDEDESKKPSKQVDDFSDAASDDGSLDEDEVMKAIKASMPGGGLSDLDDDDSDAGFDLGGDEDDDEIPEGLSGPESDEDDDDDEDQGDGDSDGDISLIGFDDSDDEDGYNTPVPSEGDAAEDVAMEGEEWGGIQTGSKRKSGREEDDERKKKKKRGALPTFASYEDYAHLLDRDDDEDGL